MGKITIVHPGEITSVAESRIKEKFSKELDLMKKQAGEISISPKPTISKLQALSNLYSFYKDFYVPGLVKVRAILEDSISEKDKMEIEALRSLFEQEINEWENNWRKNSSVADKEKMEIFELELKLKRLYQTMPVVLKEESALFSKLKALSDKYTALIDKYDKQLLPLYEERLLLQLKPLNFLAVTMSISPESTPARFKMQHNLQLLLLYPNLEDDFFID